MRTRHTIARWLGYHTQPVTTQAENKRLANRVETLEAELWGHEAQVQALVARARHTMNINPKGES